MCNRLLGGTSTVARGWIPCHIDEIKLDQVHCALVKFKEKLSIVVAGGEDTNGNKLKDVEILQFDEPDPDQEDGIKEALKQSSWQIISNLTFARSNFPSVGTVEGFLTVTAGDVDSSNPDDQVSIEQFNEGSNAWIAQKTKLKSPRFGHSTLKVSKDWCD